ncbi:MAG TPA: hypothetical protein VGK17_25010, partial [Propionicimonas sp.]
VLAFYLAARAVEAAAEFLRLGGYRPSPGDLRRISDTVCRLVLGAVPVIVEDDREISDDELLEAAQSTGRGVVTELLGPPARGALN